MARELAECFLALIVPSHQRLNDQPAWLQAGPAPRSSHVLLFREADHTQAGAPRTLANLQQNSDVA